MSHSYWAVFDDSSLFDDGTHNADGIHIHRASFDIVSIEGLSDSEHATYKKVCNDAGFLD